MTDRMIILLGIIVLVVFILGLFIGRQEEKRWMRLGLTVAAFLLVGIGLIYEAIKR